jgi:hypothetical protein
MSARATPPHPTTTARHEIIVRIIIFIRSAPTCSSLFTSLGANFVHDNGRADTKSQRLTLIRHLFGELETFQQSGQRRGGAAPKMLKE